MPTLLKNLKINTIGSVDRPANKEAVAVLVKREENADDSTLKDRLWGFVKGLFGRDPDPAQGEDISDVQKLYEDLTAVSKVGRAISTPRLGMLKQMRELLDQLIADGEKALAGAGDQKNDTQKRSDAEVAISEEIKKSLTEEVRKHIEELEKKAAQVDDLTAKYAKLEKKLGGDKGKDDQEDIWKGVNPEVRKRMEDLEKRAKDAEELVKNEREERIAKEYIAKATGFQSLPVKPEEFGLVLKSLAEKDPESYAKLEGLLKATDEAITKGALFAEFGRGGTASGGTMEKAEALAKEVVQKNAGMTKEQALTKVFKENPGLYQQYVKEQNELKRSVV